MVLLRNLSHFECSPVVASEPQLSVCVWTDPSIRIGPSSEQTLLLAQIRARRFAQLLLIGHLGNKPRAGQRHSMTWFSAGALRRSDISQAWLSVFLRHLQAVSTAHGDARINANCDGS
jgi:hypothetical protein